MCTTPIYLGTSIRRNIHMLLPPKKYFKITKKLVWCVRLDILCEHVKFVENDFFCCCICKKIKICLVKSFFNAEFCLFFCARHKTCPFSVKQLCENKNVKTYEGHFFVRLFLTFRNAFGKTPGCQNITPDLSFLFF